ncbi:nuclear transport factor 2 family protein [Kribbella solani]|uniref:nuclear transport factor 2 family protein n=1 Tax=Kribbella solani TaxID=236067 RepID=UPI0029ABCC2A|nr:nuclear transport factor 2 family protein [Kribbella solani]MDX2971314.1 nuclear transport factor 2 family protein [Kribbella solani]
MTAPELIEDATRFVAEAQRMTNERDADGIRQVFAPDARWDATLDGLIIHADGIDEICRGWATMCRFMAKRGLYVEKTLVAVDGSTIVNEWRGVIAGRAGARGIEVWQRNDLGLVTDQHLYGFLDARPDSSLVQNLRMLVAHPRTALAFAASRRC